MRFGFRGTGGRFGRGAVPPRGRALPVVQIEQHRRALGRRLQQLPELPEHVGADRVALVLVQVDTNLAFS
jgi:hypothetical protein